MRLINADALTEKLQKLYVTAFAEGDSAYHSAYRSLAKIVERTPTVNEWIPVSERLPDKDGRYLTTNSMIGKWIVDWNIWTNEPKPSWLYNHGVIAWMPLPEPYEEIEHE